MDSCSSSGVTTSSTPHAGGDDAIAGAPSNAPTAVLSFESAPRQTTRPRPLLLGAQSRAPWAAAGSGARHSLEQALARDRGRGDRVARILGAA
jgi:hypothetical protein